MFRKHKSVVGLDMGSSVIKAVEITLEGAEPVVTGFARVEIPPGGSPAEALNTLFEGGKIKGKRVVISVAGQSVVVRYLTMPRMPEGDLKQAVRFETDKHLPFELDEVVLDCQALTRSAGGAEGGEKKKEAAATMSVLLAACKNKEIEEKLRLLQGRGLTPIAIDVDLFALANAWELCGPPPEEGAEQAIALVDVGATRTSINVIVGGETCFSREINFGGADMTQAVARKMSLEVFEAEAIKRASETHELEVNTAIAPVLEDLVSDLSLSLDYVEHHEGVHVSEILLSGGGALAPGVAEHIEQATGRKTRTWNPLEGVRVDSTRVDVEELEAWAPTLVVAVGLASRVRAA